MADPLRLLFELDAEGEPAVKEFKRVSAAFATELAALKKMAASAVKLSLVESRGGIGPNDGAAAGKATLDSQREVNRQLEAMWASREKEQAASLKKQSDTERAFATQQVSTTREVESEIAGAFKDRESQLAKAAKQSEDLWAKHEAAKLNVTRQAEKESEAVTAASNAAKDKAAKLASDNFLKLQKQTAAVVVKANSQTAANEIRAALIAAKGTADISSIASKGIESLSEHLNLFIGHRIPLAGGAFIRLTENVRGFVTLSRETEGSVLRLGNIIADLSAKTGKSAPAIKDFLGSFAKLGTQIEKDEAAVNAFGPALAQKLIPQLAAADSEMKLLVASTLEAGGAFSALAGPIGIVVLEFAAMVAATLLAVKKMFDLAEASARVEGRFVDLSQQLGLSTELLSAFDILAATTGSDLGSISAAFGIFQKHLEDAQNPMSDSAGLLAELGIQTTDTETALRQTFAALAKMPEGFRQTALALQLFGRSGKSVLAIIKETNGDLPTAIKRFHELGLTVSLEDAKAADKFNDELELLHRQITDLTVELGKEFLPAARDIVVTLGDLTQSSRGLFHLIGLVGRPTIDTFAQSLTGLSLVLAALRHDSEETARILKDLADRRNIKPVQVPDVTPVPLPTGEESALKKAGEEARLVKAEVSEAVRFAESQMSEIDRQLRLREISPAQALEPIIALERSKTEAVIKELEARREARAKEFTNSEKDRQKQADDIQAIDEQIATERSRLEKVEADKRAEFRAQELQKEQEHRRALADIFISALNDRIAAVNRSAQAGINSLLFAQDVTTELLKAAFAKRKEILEQERREAGKDPALAQQINSQLADLQRERTATLSEQSDRRIEILRDEQRKQLDLQRSTIDSILRASAITDSSRIATIRALAALRVKTGEQAARAILKIRLDALDREKGIVLAERELIDQQIEARLNGFSAQRRKLEGELSKTGSISDPTRRNEERNRIAAELQANVDAEIDAQKKANTERTDADTDLNNKLRVLNAERSQIQADGNRDLDKGRQDDLDNLRDYDDALQAISDHIVDIHRQAQEEMLRLMVAHLKPRRVILAKQLDLDIKDADRRHELSLRAIKQDQVATNERINFLNKFIDALKAANKTTSDEYQKAVDDLAKANAKKAELHAEEEEELKRSEKEKERIRAEAKRKLRDVQGIFIPGDHLPDIEQGAGTIKSVTEGLKAAFKELKTIGLEAFGSLAQGIGGLVENYVLLGTTGPAALRKLLAATLAQIAAESAVKAIYWTAQGIVDLFFNPARAAADFAAAALFASIAGVSALIGRRVAGDLFQQKDTAGRAVSGGEPTPRNREFQNRSQEPVQSSAESARDGSGGLIDRAIGPLINRIEAIEQRDNTRTALIVRALDRNTQALTTIETARPDDVIMKANPGTVARQNLQGVKENWEIVPETLQTLNIR
jgi:hypothetical protein